MSRKRSTRKAVLRARVRKLRAKLDAVTAERDALLARLSRWGRPTNAKRAEAAAAKAQKDGLFKL